MNTGTIIAIVLAALSLVVSVLAYSAPRTVATWDDKLLVIFKAILDAITGSGNPPPSSGGAKA